MMHYFRIVQKKPSKLHLNELQHCVGKITVEGNYPIIHTNRYNYATYHFDTTHRRWLCKEYRTNKQTNKQTNSLSNNRTRYGNAME